MEKTIKDGSFTIRLSTANSTQRAFSYLYEKLESTDELLPNLIILSEQNGSEDSLAFIKELKSKSDLKFIPIVIFTNDYNKQKLQDYYTSYVSCYVQKPEDLNEFISTIRSIKSFWIDTASLPVS